MYFDIKNYSLSISYTRFNVRLIGCILSIIFLSNCSDEIRSEKDNSSQDIVTELAILKDSLGELSISDVSSSSYASAFIPDSITSFDKTTPVYWMRINVLGEQKDVWTLKLNYIDTIEIYTPDQRGDYVITTTGSNVKFDDLPVKFGEFTAVPIPVSDQEKTIFLRLVSHSMFSKQFRDLSRIEFFSPQKFEYLTYQVRYFHGNFLGLMFGMIMFNFIIFLLYRERSYLAYSLFMVCQTCYHLSITGFLQEFIFFDIPVIGKYSPFFVATISFFAYLYFAQVYLDSKHYSPKLNRLFNKLYLVNIVNIILAFFWIELANYVLFIIGAIAPTIALIMAIIAVRKKSRPAIYYIVASVLAYFSFCVFVLMRLEILPEVFITRYAYQITFALQAILFAMGLADKMIIMRRELAQKKRERVKLEMEQERELKRILEKQNEELELKVKERTLELEIKNREVEKDREIIKLERQKSDNLLLNILPYKIAKRLKSGEEMIADKYDNVTVFFLDIIGFTIISKRITPEELVNMLNMVFTRLDKLAIQHGLEKIKTIGDSYMCVCGLPEPKKDHAQRVARFSLDVIHMLNTFSDTPSGESLTARIGIHSGTVVAGVIGRQKFAYDLWGECVNIASRLESQGEEMKIQCSEEVYQLLKGEFIFEERGEVDLRGIGKRRTFFLVKSKTFEMAHL